MSNDIVTNEIRELTTPIDSKLALVIAKVDTLPDMIPRSVASLLCRIAFAAGYAQLNEDMLLMNETFINDVSIEAIKFIDKGFETVDIQIQEFLNSKISGKLGLDVDANQHCHVEQEAGVYE